MNANSKPTPRGPIEREYLAMLNAAVPLDTWQAICKRAADDAFAGDAWAGGRDQGVADAAGTNQGGHPGDDPGGE